MKFNFDIEKTPLVVIWEANHSNSQPEDPCCATCPGLATVKIDVVTKGARPDLLDLDSQEAEKLIRDVAELAPPVFAITGSDPLQRKDLYSLIRYAVSCGLHPLLAANATPLLDRDAIGEMKHAGLSRLSVSLDAATPEMHDLICGVHGAFERTIGAMRWANEFRLPFQINTNLNKYNLNMLEDLAALLKGSKAVLWTVTFPVPAVKGEIEELPSAMEFELAFATLYKLAKKVPFKIKTIEAQHYRRYVLQQKAKERADKSALTQLFEEGVPGVLPVNEALATVFISSTGEVCPTPALRLSGGNIRIRKLADIYRMSELFVSLRDSSNLKGKCGECGFNEVCGGSRARALVLDGDLFEKDPTCIYNPGSQARVRNKRTPKLPLQSVAVEKP